MFHDSTILTSFQRDTWRRLDVGLEEFVSRQEVKAEIQRMEEEAEKTGAICLHWPQIANNKKRGEFSGRAKSLENF